MSIVTEDYQYLIVIDNESKLKTKKEIISKDTSIETIALGAVSKIKDNTVSKEAVASFKQIVRSKYPDFFDDKSYALNYTSAYEVLGFMSDYSKKQFIYDVDHYINAYALNHLYVKYDNDPNIIAYSHRKRGWNAFQYKVYADFKFAVITNFGYGSSSYFDMILYWKELPLINYLHIIFYRYSSAFDLKRVTESYSVNPESWVVCFDNLIEYIESFYNNGEKNFVKSYLENAFEQLINGLNLNLHTNIFLDLSKEEINKIYRSKSAFYTLLLNELTGDNILKRINMVDIDNVRNILVEHKEVITKIKEKRIKNEEINIILSLFIESYANNTELEAKARIYLLMIDCAFLLEKKPNDEMVSPFFDWLLSIFESHNGNKEKRRFLYYIKDTFDLQLNRTNQMKLAIKAFIDAKNSTANYLYTKHISRLKKMILMLNNQNISLLNKIKEEEKELESKISCVEEKYNEEHTRFINTQCYKNNEAYKFFFKVIKCVPKCVRHHFGEKEIAGKSDDSIIDEIINLKQNILNYCSNNCDFNNSVNWKKDGLISYQKVTSKLSVYFNSICRVVYLGTNDYNKMLVSFFCDITAIINNFLSNNDTYNNYKQLIEQSVANLIMDVERFYPIIEGKDKIIRRINSEEILNIIDIIIDIYIDYYKKESCEYNGNNLLIRSESKLSQQLNNQLKQFKTNYSKTKREIKLLEEYVDSVNRLASQLN